MNWRASGFIFPQGPYSLVKDDCGYLHVVDHTGQRIATIEPGETAESAGKLLAASFESLHALKAIEQWLGSEGRPVMTDEVLDQYRKIARSGTVSLLREVHQLDPAT